MSSGVDTQKGTFQKQNTAIYICLQLLLTN